MAKFEKGNKFGKGRPKKKSLDECIRDLLEGSTPALEEMFGEGATTNELIANKLIETWLANPGNTKLIQFIIERAYGKAPQQLDINKTVTNIDGEQYNQQFIDWHKQQLLEFGTDSNSSQQSRTDSEASEADEMADGSNTAQSEE